MPRQFRGEKIVFSANYAGTTRYPHVEEWSWTAYLIPCTKIYQKWNKGLKLKKILEGIPGVSLHDPGLGNNFLDTAPKAQAAKGKNR